MELKYGFISADDHVQEHPEVWTKRMSKAKWGDRIPHVERQADGTERWVVDGKKIDLPGVALAGAAMPDRAREPQRWEEVPERHLHAERAPDGDGCRWRGLFRPLSDRRGAGGRNLRPSRRMPELELACVQAYNDWLIEEWAAVSPRFIPQCIVPLAPIEATVNEIKRAVAKGHRGVVMPSVPMMLREVPHINEPVYDPVWATCQELDVPVCFHSGATRDIQFPPYAGFSPEIACRDGSDHAPGELGAGGGELSLFARILERFPRLKVDVRRNLARVGRLRAGARRPPVRAPAPAHRGLRSAAVGALQAAMPSGRVVRYDGAEDPPAHRPRQSALEHELSPGTSTWPESRQAIARCFRGRPRRTSAGRCWSTTRRSSTRSAKRRKPTGCAG